MIQGQVRVDLLLDSLACWVLLSIFLFSVCFGLRSSHSNVLLDECCYQQCQRGVAPYDTWIDASCDKDLDAEFIFLSLDREENSNAGRSDVSDSNAYLQVLDTSASYDLSAG